MEKAIKKELVSRREGDGHLGSSRRTWVYFLFIYLLSFPFLKRRNYLLKWKPHLPKVSECNKRNQERKNKIKESVVIIQLLLKEKTKTKNPHTTQYTHRHATTRQDS